MKIISRLSQKLSADDLVSTQVASALLGITPRTLIPFVEQGKLKTFPAPQAGWTEKRWSVFRVSDLVCFATLNSFAFDKKMLDNPKLGYRHIVSNYLMYLTRPQRVEKSKYGLPVTLKQLINVLDVSPYTPILFGDEKHYCGSSFLAEFQRAYDPFFLQIWGIDHYNTVSLFPYIKDEHKFVNIQDVDDYFVKLQFKDTEL